MFPTENIINIMLYNAFHPYKSQSILKTIQSSIYDQ